MDDTMADETAADAARLRRSRRLAIAAFLATITAAFLAWWRVTWSSGGSAIRDDVRLFRPEEPLTTTAGPHLTGVLVAATVILLFVRIAARSDLHEPKSWRRDLGIAAGLVAAALGSCLLWPADVPAFWGGRTYSVQNVTTEVTETAMPGLGWWVAVVAFLLLLAARVLARPTTDK